MKKLKILFTSVLIAATFCFSAYAGEWRQDAVGAWYDNGDSTFARDGWTWIDNKCYYFTPEGYCLINTTTPDGLTVNADGAWAVEGHVVSETKTYTVGSLVLTVPEGIILSADQKEDSATFMLRDLKKVIAVLDQGLMADSRSVFEESELEKLLDETISESYGAYTAKAILNMPSGAWTRYDYAETIVAGLQGTSTIFIRFNGDRLQQVIFVGNFAEFVLSPDSLMSMFMD